MLYIFDKQEKLLTILDNTADTAPITKAFHIEQLNREHNFTFSISADHADAVHVEEGNLVAFEDIEGDFQLFEIDLVEDSHTDEAVRDVTCEHASYEMLDDYVEDYRPQSTALDALTKAILGTRWQVGIVADLGINSTNFYRENPISCIHKIVSTWGGELRYRITVVGNAITGRYVDILARRGADTGKRFEYGKDLVEVKRTVGITQLKTALRGFGKGEEALDEEGNPTGGHGRRIDFKDMVWSIANGDPCDKPYGQDWVGDEAARSLFGRPNPNGSMRHRFGIFEDSEIEDIDELLQVTYNNLQTVKIPLLNYEMKVIDMERITGYEHEKVRLGDTASVIDDEINPVIELKSRIIELRRDLLEPENDEVVVGQFLPLFTDADPAIQKVIAKVNDNAGIWDSEPVITDENFPDIIPPAPINVKADGLFQNVMVSWDYNGASYIKAYEVYASEISSFVSSPENLVFRGKTSGFSFEGQTNKQYYFRVRAINYHDKASAYSAEVTATTARIITDDILFGAITAAKIANLAITAAKIANLAITAEKLANGSITNDKILDNAITSLKIAEGEVKAAQIAVNAITEVKIAANAITATKILDGAIAEAKIAAGAVTAAKVGTGAITNVKLAALAVDAAKLASGAVTTIKLANNAVDNDKLANLAVTAANLVDGAVTVNKIGTGAITSVKLADLAVDAAKLANSSVTSTKIANLAVGSAAIADAAITNAKIDRVSINKLVVGTADIEDAAINSAKIGSLAVGTAAIATGAITNAKIGALAVDTAQIATAAITAAKIENLAVGNAAIANGAITNAKITDLDAGKITAGTINAARIAANSITGTHIAGNTITAAQIAALTITAAEIVAGTITGNKLVANTITATQIAANTLTAAQMVAGTITAVSGIIGTAAITTANIANLAVGTAAIANLGVTTAKIDNLAVTAAQIANATITSAKIGLLAVDTANIANGAITNAKIDTLSATKITTGTLSSILINGVSITGSTFQTTADFGSIIKVQGQSLISGGVSDTDSNHVRATIVGSTFTSRRKNTTQDIWMSMSPEQIDGTDAINSRTTFLRPDRLTFSAGGIQRFSLVTTATTANIEMTGLLSVSNAVISNTLNASSFILQNTMQLRTTNGAYQRADSRVDATNFSRTHWYGISDTGATSNFRHSWYDGSAYITMTCTAGRLLTIGGSLEAINATFQGSLTVLDGNWLNAGALDSVNQHLYARMRSGGELRVTQLGTTTTYMPVRASAFPVGSLLEYKQDITEWEVSALDKINSCKIYNYKLRSEFEQEDCHWRQGLVIGEGYAIDPDIIDKDGIEQYQMNSWSWKAIQELSDEVDFLKREIAILKAS